MAIEFKCQYCNAMIRVPDNAGGGKGRCPKCAMRITVPKKSTQKQAPKPTDDDEPFVLPVADPTATNDDLPSIVSNEPVVVLEAAPAVFDPTELTKPRIGEFPVERPISVARRLKKRKQGNLTGMIVGTIVLGLLGVAGYFVYPQLVTERISGDVMAGTAETLELPPALIEKSRFRLSPEVIDELLKKLELNPVPLNSNSMQIQLAGSEKGLKVAIQAGLQAHFYRIDLKGNDPLEKYLSRHVSELEDQRSGDIDRSANEFLIEYQKVLAKKSPPESLTPFRDSLALVLLAGGVGNELVAKYGLGLYRCAYQDRDGGLYFLLPEGIKEFEVIGRDHRDGRRTLPAKFKVTVKGGIARAKTPEKANTPKKPKAPSTKSSEESRPVDEEMTPKK